MQFVSTRANAQITKLEILLNLYFLSFLLPATPPANRPRLLKLDLGLCPSMGPGGAGVGGGLIALAGLPGLSPAGFGGTAGVGALGPIFSCTSSSSPMLAIRWLRLAFSCVCLNLSSNSVHLTLPPASGPPRPSLGFKRPGRSNVEALVPPDDGIPLPLLLFEPTSELFCRKWFRVGEDEEG